MRRETLASMPAAGTRVNWRAGLVASLALLWAAIVLVSYYEKLWQLVLAAPRLILLPELWAEPRHSVEQTAAASLLAIGAGFGVVLALRLAARLWRSDSVPPRLAAALSVAGFGALMLACIAFLPWLDRLAAQAPARWPLPYMPQAAARALGGLGGAALILLSAWLVGAGISRALRWRYDHWSEQLCFGLSLGLGALSYLGLLLAVFGRYMPMALTVIVGATLAAGALAALARRGRVTALAVRATAAVRWAPRARPSRANALWMLCAGLATGMALIAALAPEIEFDALWYHLTYPRMYLEQGRLVDMPHDYVSLYPMTWELLFGYGLALGGPVAAKLLHFAMLPLTAVLLHRLARRFVPGASPWLAVALFASVPTVMWEASTAYIDLALGFHLLLLLYALLRHAEGQQRQWLLLAGLNLGLALASKHLALFYLGLSGLGLVLWQLRRGGAGAWKRAPADWSRQLAAALRPAVLLAVLGLLLASPWYVRSLLASGNPFFPELFGIFGAPPERWNAMSQAGLDAFLSRFGPPRTLWNMLSLPWHMTVHGAAYQGALGPLFLLLLPGLAVARRLRGAAIALAAFVAGVIVLWASPLASLQMRFLIPLAPLLAVLAAAGAGRLLAAQRAAFGQQAARWAAYGLAGLLVLNLPLFTALHERDRVNWDGWINHALRQVPLGVVLGAESQEAYLTRNVRSYGVWQHASQTLPPEARVLTWSGGEQFYTRHERVWANATALGPVAWAPAGDFETAVEGLRSHGITHVIVERRDPPASGSWDDYALTGQRAASELYEQLYQDRHYTLYRIRWEDWPGESR